VSVSFKQLLFEVSSTNAVATSLKKELTPHLFPKRSYEMDALSDMQDFDYEDYVDFMWEDIIDTGSQSVKLRIRNYSRLPEFKGLRGRSDRKYEETATSYFNGLVKESGWHVSSVNKRKKLKVVFRKNGGKLVEVDSSLYHVTYKEGVDEILQNGLKPKEGKNTSFLYPERIYLFTEYNESLFERFVIEKSNTNVTPQKRMAGGIAKPPYSILEIEGVENYTFYKDRDIKNSVWTNQSIPASKIEHLKTKD